MRSDSVLKQTVSKTQHFDRCLCSQTNKFAQFPMGGGGRGSAPVWPAAYFEDLASSFLTLDHHHWK